MYNDFNYNLLFCDECNALLIFEDGEYKCPECGLIGTEQLLKYNVPYDKNKIQNDTYHLTSIGSSYERRYLSDYSRLCKLDRFSHSYSCEINKRARLEINRIFEALRLSSEFKESIFTCFKKIHSGLRSGSRYRNPEKLVPLIVYFVLRINNLYVNKKELLNISKISVKEFRNFLLRANIYFPTYLKKNKKRLVSQALSNIKNSFGFSMKFLNLAELIKEKLWNNLCNSKEDIIAGVVGSLAYLYLYRFNKRSKSGPSVHKICDKLNVRMSSIHGQIYKNIVIPYNLKDYLGISKSKSLLIDFVDRLIF